MVARPVMAEPCPETPAPVAGNVTPISRGMCQKNKALREAMIVEHLPLVRMIAGRIARRLPSHVDGDDLVNVGVLGLIEAVDRFDPARGTPFKSYAELRIRGAIVDSLRQSDWVPQVVRRQISRIEATRSRLRQRTGAEPGRLELAAALELTPEAYDDLVGRVAVRGIVPLDAPGDEEGGLALSERVADGAPGAVDTWIGAEAHDAMAGAIRALPEMQRDVLRLYYDGGLKYREIGRVLGVCESRVCQLRTIVQDAPLIYNSLDSKLWKPENFDEEYLGDITLRNALSLSRNVVTVRVLDVIKLEPVEQMARRLGIESPMEIDLSMGLGSSSLKMPELARAYSAFATMGQLVEPHYVNRVLDRDDKVLEQWERPEWKRVLDPNVAGVMNWLLQDIAQTGTAAKAQRLGLHVGGKTGTTNFMHDAWFVGFTPTVLTAVWVGYDQPRSLGAASTGGYTALPIWMDYMADAAPKAEDKPFALPGTLVWASIDERTGRPMTGGRSMPFLPGTAPTGVAVEAGQKTTEDLISGEF